MSTIERREYQQTKVMRTVSPVRNIRSSNQNLAEFDNNLDYLLEDLQNSVSRPGSSLGNHREAPRAIESSKTNSLNRFTTVKPSNPVTEYNSDDAYNYLSPDGKKRVYKKESYSYKTTSNGGTLPEKSRMQNNINQLDSLLDDLQQVKNAQLLEKESYNNTGADPDFQNTAASRRTVHRELHYGDTPRSGSRGRPEKEGSVTRDTQYSSEGTYGDIRQIRGRSPSPSSRTSTLTKQTKVSNVQNYPMAIVETTTPDINPEILAHLDPALHPPGNTKVTTTIKTYTYEIPGAGNYPTNLDSSVVDTEKYVYSPNQTSSIPSKSFVYKQVENNSSENTINYPAYQKPSGPSGHTIVKETVTTRNYQPGFKPEVVDPTYVYNETTTTRNINDNVTRGSLPRNQLPPRQTYIVEEHNTTTNINDNVGKPRSQPPPRQTYIVEEHNTTTNINDNVPRGSLPRSQPPPRQTYIVEERNTTTNINDNVPRGSLPRNQPPPRQTYIVEEHNTTTNRNVNRPYPDDRDYPRGNPPRQETYIIKEIHDRNTTNHPYPDGPDRDYPPPTHYIKEVYDNNTTNVRRGYPNGYPPSEPGKTIIYRHESHTTNNYGPDGRPIKPDVETFDPNHPPYPNDKRPNEPVNISYRYKSESTTTNNYKAGYPPNEESEPLLPRPFPTDNQPDGPPRRLDELMANIGNEPPNSPYNAGFNAHEHELEQMKKIETLKKQQKESEDLQQKKEPVLKSKNVSGPPVYYPPGHELFAKKEEAGAWRAEGGYERASGKYKYEAESSSKSKSSSGAAIVPVCLPLCCGLPCAII